MRHSKNKIEFPVDFLWGSATSAYQIEGGENNDWSFWEKENTDRLAREAGKEFKKEQLEKFPKIKDPANYCSGVATDHYQKFEEDFSLMKDLNLKAYRLSLEWSRLMPKENKFSIKAVKHYQEILKSLSQKGIEPWITLCHWTIPQWLSQKGGLENPHFVKYFSQYTAFVLKHLGNYCSYWLIFNEPGIVLAKGFGGRGEWPNQKRNLLSLIKAFNNLKKAHWQAYKLIHQNNQHSLVATSHNLGCWEPSPSTSIKARLLTRFFKFLGNEIFIRSFRGDFLAVQYYFRFLVSSFNVQKKNVFPKGSDMGWEIYPKGIYRVLMDLKKYKLPIYITENGLADAFDQKRTRFIKDHLYWINKAIKEGVPVRGYFYWSFLDNFEWDKGFWTRFGLVAVDYKTQKRTVRKSALVYGKIAQNNGFYL